MTTTASFDLLNNNNALISSLARWQRRDLNLPEDVERRGTERDQMPTLIISLMGVGGSGKTTLAVAIKRAMTEISNTNVYIFESEDVNTEKKEKNTGGSGAPSRVRFPFPIRNAVNICCFSHSEDALKFYEIMQNFDREHMEIIMQSPYPINIPGNSSTENSPAEEFVTQLAEQIKQRINTSNRKHIHSAVSEFLKEKGIVGGFAFV